MDNVTFKVNIENLFDQLTHVYGLTYINLSHIDQNELMD